MKLPSTLAKYRPISVTSVLAHIFDKLIAKHFLYPAIHDKMSRNGFNNQFAFRPTASTEAAIIKTVDIVTNYLAISNKYVNMLCLDVAKAFDTIVHKFILNALLLYNIGDEVYNLIIDYLSHRQHSTRFQGQTSDFENINSAVIQGSGLGPVLYSMATSNFNIVHKNNSS